MALTKMFPQGPNVHCGLLSPHDKHANPKSRDVATWCDGVPPLEPFYELTIRLPLEALHVGDPFTHQEALDYLQDNGGLMLLTSNIREPESSVVLRVRAGGEDRYYPVLAGKDGGFLKVVVDAPQLCDDPECAVDHSQTTRPR